MIYDHIENRSRYSGLLGIEKALDYLADLKPDNTPAEITLLDGDELIANPLAYATKPQKECTFESHCMYADIHYMLSGEETISIASAEGLKVTKAYSTDNDTVYYDGYSASSSVMRPGYFMVCFPQDVHRTGEAAAKPCDIRKIVMKVK